MGTDSDVRTKIKLDDIAGVYLSAEIIDAIERTGLKPSEIERLINSQPKFSVAVIDGELDFCAKLRVPLKPSWKTVVAATVTIVAVIAAFM